MRKIEGSECVCESKSQKGPYVHKYTNKYEPGKHLSLGPTIVLCHQETRIKTCRLLDTLQEILPCGAKNYVRG